MKITYHMGNDSSYDGDDGCDHDKEEAEIKRIRRIGGHHEIEDND